VSVPDQEPAAGPPAAGPPAAGPPAAGPNPRTERAVRGALAAALTLEALVVLLVPRAIAQFGSGLAGWKLAVLLTLAGLLVVTAALAGRRAGRLLGSALQVALIACGLLTAAMFVLGAVFAAIWIFLLRLRRELLTPPGAGRGDGA
jgi:hypothetical protein